MKRDLLFSVTLKDCRVEEMTAGGPGGQNQNRRHTAIRITHPPSGAVGESREERKQGINKVQAFVRMTQTKEFLAWHRLETARRLAGEISIQAMAEKAVERQMKPSNLKVEGRNEAGQWEVLREEPAHT